MFVSPLDVITVHAISYGTTKINGATLYYSIENDEVTITSCSEDISGDVIIPSTLGGYPVTRIGNYAFQFCNSLLSVTIPESIKVIGECIFDLCDSFERINITNIATWCNINFESSSCNPLIYTGKLYINGTLATDIVIPDNVTRINNNSFYNCDSLTSVTIPDSVTSIGNYAFENCDSLTSIAIPDSVTSIGSLAFTGCDLLETISIGKNVLDIGNYAFTSCNSLSKINVNSENSSFCSNDGVLFNKNNSRLIFYPKGRKETKYNIPYGTLEICESAFYNCDILTEISIPNTLETIGGMAFMSCTSLTSINLPDSVENIGHLAFSDCTSLSTITLSKNIVNLGGEVFSNTKYIKNPDNWENDVIYIGNYLIEAKRTVADNYLIKPNTKIIASFSFYGCSSLTTITIPSTVKNVGEYSFFDCKSLKTVKFLGSKKQWDEINIGILNDDLLNANIIFDYIQDLNGDSSLDSADVVLMKKAVLGTNELTAEDSEAYDLNGDGKLDILDLIRIKKLLTNV